MPTARFHAIPAGIHPPTEAASATLMLSGCANARPRRTPRLRSGPGLVRESAAALELGGTVGPLVVTRAG
ncbi:MAG: hypothetical protein AB2A00_20995 [Myxococcota bacterium]